MILARKVTFDITHGKDHEFKNMFNTEILPLLKKQEGFRDEMVLVKENKGIGISLWKNRESLDKYSTTVFPEITKKLTPYLTTHPTVEVYEVTNATINLN